MSQASSVVTTVKLGRIRPGLNPRTYFDPKEMSEMRASVRADGILQSILVRPQEPGWYQLVDGERRYRAATEELDSDYDVPVVIREMSDAEAKRYALVTNIQRANMSATEEAAAAAEVLGTVNGDRDEAARVIGWSRSTLDRRLALMACSVATRDALNTRAIQIGHAELLATLSKDKQDVILPVIIAEKKSVAELRKTIEGAACSLEKAIFDKGECAACPHNSSLQTELFGEAIASGNCTNRACYDKKGEAQLESVAYTLKDEYPVIRIVRAGDNHTRVQLVAEGPTGVGEEQAKACHACERFGAAVSALPDSIGKVFRGQCFDPSCNTKMVAARLKAERDAKSAAQQPKQPAAAVASAGKGSSKASADEKPVTKISESEKVKAYRVALWRKALRREVAAAPEVANRYLLALTLSGQARTIGETAMGQLFAKITEDSASVHDLAKNLVAIDKVAEEKRVTLSTAMTVAAIEGVDVPNLVALCRHHKLDLRKHWNLQHSKDFLELLTKSEMKVLADELGLRKQIGAGFAKVFGKSKPELIEALITVDGFEYAGKLPKVLQY
ncbi:chromosome partitioning protein ParB (plasmid) [Cupriavidus sp. USMAA2-4]|jgi:PRTRC genetic system ParB family protein|uniref:PRTRC system ParB family protein n=1 Tax=unclassified Cupriavidus TaxID=2640874 RepID=UPI0008A68116|nr:MULTISPECIES: PRTRC system ParB family protein [unclassified Cupriavidus]AOY97741.1 chromosome partitioning protein ParB [Cupriavidus sp. USMAA2-4]AOZ04223.1 chromosome partitioning protein ParB [Cupriavidus sp. USMAHM13]